jgi:putative iron-regulated protein
MALADLAAVFSRVARWPTARFAGRGFRQFTGSPDCFPFRSSGNTTMQKREFLKSALRAGFAAATTSAGFRAFAQPAGSTPVDANAVVKHYAVLVQANYTDTLASTQDMQRAIQAFLAAPSSDSLAQARKSWLAAREWYLQTEAFRFYGGPIDDEKGPEGRINSWPMDESYLDYVVGKDNAGVINDRRAQLTKAAIVKLNERGGEENISTGWHAIEFLLWGQDLSESGPGDRPFTDYLDGKRPNADRRRTYLQIITALLVEDLGYLVKAWQPSGANYRAQFEAGGVESLRKMLVGMGSLSRGELAGERLEVAMNTQDQEDEHSCFSDNTHRDVVGDALGIENVWLGRYKRRDGSLLTGASLKDLVAAKDAAVAERVTRQIAQTMTAANAIEAPFDREIIGGKNAPGRIRIQKTIDSLVQQSKDFVDAAAALGITRLTQAKAKA